jgi:hypothetical protein
MDSASAKVTAEVAVEKAIRDQNYRSLSKPLRNAAESKIELQAAIEQAEQANYKQESTEQGEFTSFQVTTGPV